MWAWCHVATRLPSTCVQVSTRFPPGTRVWVRVVGSGRWPGVAWAFDLSKRRDMGQLLLSYKSGGARVQTCSRCTLLLRWVTATCRVCQQAAAALDHSDTPQRNPLLYLHTARSALPPHQAWFWCASTGSTRRCG